LCVAGVPAAKFRTICSAIDKLDKEPWAGAYSIRLRVVSAAAV
jgi:hypothetical protein